MLFFISNFSTSLHECIFFLDRSKVLPLSGRNYDLAQAAFRRHALRRGIYSFLKCRQVPSLPCIAPTPLLAATLLQLRDGLAATPLLFELTSFPVMRENRYGYTAYPTSYKWRLFGSLSVSVYTTTSAHRCASPLVDADPTKFAGSTSFAERGTGRKGKVSESGSKPGTDDGRTRRNERGSSVVIARVMLPVSLLLLPLLSPRRCRCRCR